MGGASNTGASVGAGGSVGKGASDGIGVGSRTGSTVSVVCAMIIPSSVVAVIVCGPSMDGGTTNTTA